MKKFKLFIQKFIDILYKINNYYVNNLWLRIFLAIFYYFIVGVLLFALTVFWLDVFEYSICGEDVLCCILSYFTFYTVLVYKCS